MTTRRRITTDELITELIAEIRADRMASTKREERVETELVAIRTVLATLGQDFREFRSHVLKHEDESGKELRAVEDFVGLTDPREKNGR